MHGDVDHPHEAILTKEQYEHYFQTHEPFINALTGELITKTFLFIGFSFNDPNLDYVLSRLNLRFREDKRQHFCFVKKQNPKDYTDKAEYEYAAKKQYLIINDLKRYGIKSLLINGYNEITIILQEIEKRFKEKTIFISGSAEIYDPIDKNDALNFIHLLSKKIIEKEFRIVNGFGWGIGSSVINGALEAIYSKPNKYSENQLILKPFPQFKSGKKELPELWEDYRQRIIFLSGISIFLFGNKKVDEEIIEANGVIREFEIAHSYSNICIPIAFTGYASKRIYEIICDNPKDYYEKPDIVLPYLDQLEKSGSSLEKKVKIIIDLLTKITK